jgi:hypothetical protein
MTPEDEKTFKIMFATFEFDITETIKEIIRDTVTSILEKYRSDEIARRRERCW